jgi:hypothetical protein
MSNPTSRYQPPSTQHELILAWVRRSRESQLAHYEMATILQERGTYLGWPVIVITAAVGTSAFVSLTNSPSKTTTLVVGLVSILAAVLSSLQTFFKFSERSETHRVFGAKYGSLRRELEGLFVSDETLDERVIDAVRRKIDLLAEDAPAIPERIFSKIQRETLFIENGQTKGTKQRGPNKGDGGN